MLILVALFIVVIVAFAVIGWALVNIIGALIIGAIIGALARLVVPGRQELGVFSTVLIGWIGSFVGGILGRHVFHVGTLLTLLVEVAVAAVLVAIASGGVGNAVARRNSSLRY